MQYEKGTPVLITTEHRGVFFGYVLEDRYPEYVHLERARNVFKWSAKIKGFLGLAEVGPTKECQVTTTPPPDSKFGDVTSVTRCSEKAVKAFEAAKWD